MFGSHTLNSQAYTTGDYRGLGDIIIGLNSLGSTYPHNNIV